MIGFLGEVGKLESNTTAACNQAETSRDEAKPDREAKFGSNFDSDVGVLGNHSTKAIEFCHGSKDAFLNSSFCSGLLAALEKFI